MTTHNRQIQATAQNDYARGWQCFVAASLSLALSCASTARTSALLAVVLASMVSATSADADTIVDLDALVNASNNPVQITLGAGPWLVTPIDVSGGGAYTAWSAWSSNGGCAPDGTGCTRGWVNSYHISSASLGTIDVFTLPLSIFATPELAFANTLSTTFTLNQAELVSFFITDSPNSLGDNRGGMSLMITVPEPTTCALAALALGLLAHGHRRRE